MKVEYMIGIIIGWGIGELTSREVGAFIALVLIAILFVENNFTIKKRK